MSNNYFLGLGIIAAQGIHLLAMHLPLMQKTLILQHVPWIDWVKLFFTASIVVLVMELFKAAFGKRGKIRRVIGRNKVRKNERGM